MIRSGGVESDGVRGRRHLELLVEAAGRLVGVLDSRSAVSILAAIAVPAQARWSAVWLRDDRERPGRVEAGEAPETLREAIETQAAALLDGRPASSARAASDGAFLVVPVPAAGPPIGALAWLAPEDGAYTAEDALLAARIADLGGAALRAARRFEEAQAGNRRKDEFLATLSHELRTPLAAVLGWASLVRDGDLEPEEARRALDAIERNARAQARLVDDVLEVSRIATGKVRLTCRPLDLAGSVRGTVEAFRPLAEQQGLALRLEVPPERAMVLGDADRLRQVWSNLLSNAIKFTPPGGTVTVAVRRRGEQREVAVRDTGEGIAPEVLPHVFERFRQGDSPSARGHGGLGLGLALVRHFVERLGGAVEARSDGPGCGAELLVRLPALPPEQAQARPPADRPAAPSLAGVSVLLVEDDPDIRAVMGTMLSRRGATVVEAASVAQALAAVDHTPPHVVLSDLQMPGEDGYTLLARLKERERAGAPPIPAAAVTAHAGEEHRARALAAGFCAQVAKPVDAETLATLVARLARGPGIAAD